TVTALYVIGRFFGAIIAVMVGDLLGRKETIFIGASILAVGAIMHITALSRASNDRGPHHCRTGNDINTSSAPHWQSETSEASWRGNLVDLKTLLDFPIRNGLHVGFSFVGGPVSWRFPLAFQFTFIFLLLGTVP
ncbi:hypothetical protein F5882DRAFT_306644, partial [Hyaloscypha sp. PMI_1271]